MACNDDEHENNHPSISFGQHFHGGSALQGLGPRKKPCRTDPLIGHGRHFGRTIHAFCNIHSLLVSGILWMADSYEDPEDSFTAVERREHRVFKSLLALVPSLEARLMNESTSEQDVRHIADLKGSNSGRSDDTKGLKSTAIDWITPRDQPLMPPLIRNSKDDRGFNHDATGSLLCPAGMDWSDPEVKAKLRNGEYIIPGDQWPIFLWKNSEYNPDDPWNGFLRSKLLISAFKYVFTSPSSVERAPKATRSGNARLHGMTQVNSTSLAYIATQAGFSCSTTESEADDGQNRMQIRFALSTAPVFTRTDTETDSVRFYNTLLEFLEDPDEREEVNQLLVFWNQLVFPAYVSSKVPVTKDSALAQLKRKRAEYKLRSISNTRHQS